MSNSQKPRALVLTGYGLNCDAETAAALGIDDPLQPLENVRGGSRYLRLMIDRYGDLDPVDAGAAHDPDPGEDRFLCGDRRDAAHLEADFALAQRLGDEPAIGLVEPREVEGGGCALGRTVGGLGQRFDQVERGLQARGVVDLGDMQAEGAHVLRHRHVVEFALVLLRLAARAEAHGR